MIVREANTADLKSLLEINLLAFGEEEGPEVVQMVKDLLDDPSAKPLLSLVAEKEDHKLVGHILFTRAQVEGRNDINASILAPLAILPGYQKLGIGGLLIREGLRLLAKSETDLVFVLGHPEYYPRHGFITAGARGFDAPYPIPDEVAGAWMVQDLKPGLISRVKGRVVCAKAMDRPEYWSE